jgi:hypothetical protein
MVAIAQKASEEAMADDPADAQAATDYAEHARTYAGFVRAIGVVIAVVAVVLIGMVLFLVP